MAVTRVALIITVAYAGNQRSKCKDKNQCLDNPCQNGGTFTQNDECFTCSCTDGFVGAYCTEVPVELAKGKPAEQSSTYLTYSATLAVDEYSIEDRISMQMCQTDCGMLPSLLV
uniref:EGF-like domain-containing protein n=1 Tax=Magallana gigas TaxID=29159 RepID=A0A8W8P2D7_MAGGI